MTKSHRIVLVSYCLLLAYCCVWIPWCIPRHDSTCERVGYGWLWAGPAIKGDVFDQVFPDPHPQWDRAIPDLELMALRILAASAVSGAAFLLAGMRKSSANQHH